MANSLCDSNKKNNETVNSDKQFGNPTYDYFLVENEINLNNNQTVEPNADIIVRPKARERTTIKKKNSDTIYTNVTSGSSNTSCYDNSSEEISEMSVNRKSDDLPKLISELESILNCLSNDDFFDKTIDEQNESPEQSPERHPIPKIIPRRSLSGSSSTSTSSSSLTTRPLPEPPKDIPPPKPPHLPPEIPPPPLPEYSSPPKVPPRNAARDKLNRDNVDLEDKVMYQTRKFSEPYIKDRKPIAIARSQTMKGTERPTIEKRNNSPNDILKPKILYNKSDNGILQKCGFLWKTGSNRREFLDRWCVLYKNDLNVSEAVLAYYTDRKTTTARGKILLKDIAFIRITPTITSKSKLPNNSGVELSNFCFFEVGVNCKRGRVYLFAAKCLSDLRLWINVISQAIAFDNICIKDTNMCGYIFMKHGISGQWITNFVVLSRKSLMVFNKISNDCENDCEDSDGDNREPFKTFDLRKVISISYASAHRVCSCHTVQESGQPLCLTFANRVLYFQAEYKTHTELWYQSLIKLWSIPDNGKLEDQYLTNENIPVAVDKCLNFISTYGIDRVNVFIHQNFQSPFAIAVCDALRSNAWDLQLKSEIHSIHDITTALLLFLKSMSECILTEKLYHNWIKANEEENRNERLKKFKLLLRLLPKVNYLTLKKLIAHLVCIVENSDKNQTCILNIAPAVCHSILFLKVGDKIVDDRVSTFEGDSAGIDIMTDCILSYKWLFDVTQEELEKERKIQKAMELLKETKELSQSCGQKTIDREDFLIGVYVYSKEWGKCLNVRLTPSMTASDLIQYIIKQTRIKDRAEKLAVYEIVCNDQMERVLHYSDIVLGITLSWIKWCPEYAKDNYLCVKQNQLYEQISPHIADQTPITIFAELKYADKNSKSFKKVLVEFIGAKLSLYKDEKGEKLLGQWNIEDITWYLGSEKKRSVNNKLSITFIDRNSEINKSKDNPYFGRTICCNNDEEYHKWIAGMLCAEYPNGLIPVKPQTDLLN